MIATKKKLYDGRETERENFAENRENVFLYNIITCFFIYVKSAFHRRCDSYSYTGIYRC